MQGVTFEKDEIRQIIAGLIVLAFMFSFTIEQTFSQWLKEFTLMFILAGASLYVNLIAHKYAAYTHGANAKFELWTIQRFGFSKAAILKSKPADPLLRLLYNIAFFPTNLWLIVPILVAFFSNGQLPFAAVGITSISITAAHRLGKKYLHASEIESAKIALVGPITNLLFALIIKTLFGFSGIAGDLVTINIALAISNMLPIPRLDGSKVFFGSILLYIFSTVFILGSSFLIFFLTFFPTLILSLIFALTLLILYYYFHVFR